MKCLLNCAPLVEVLALVVAVDGEEDGQEGEYYAVDPDCELGDIQEVVNTKGSEGQVWEKITCTADSGACRTVRPKNVATGRLLGGQ